MHTAEAVKGAFEHETIDKQDYWFLRPRAPIMEGSPTAYLLSVYDEYISGYKDRSAMEGEDFARLLSSMGNTLQYVILIGGRFVGTGKRILKKDAVIVQLNTLLELTQEEKKAIAEAAERFGAFLELPVMLEM
jgi:hypothetical protein